MADYNFTRSSVDGVWNINNPKDVDANGMGVSLAKRIRDALPGKAFKISGSGSNVTLTFESALDAGDETTLNTTVSTHQAASGTPATQTMKNFISPDGKSWWVCVDNSGVVETSAGE